jgi:hypothetical protein
MIVPKAASEFLLRLSFSASAWLNSVTIPYLDAGKIGQDARGMLGNKCAGQHNLKTGKPREIM